MMKPKRKIAELVARDLAAGVARKAGGAGAQIAVRLRQPAIVGYLLLNAEPELDCANPQLLVTASVGIGRTQLETIRSQYRLDSIALGSVTAGSPGGPVIDIRPASP